MPRKPADFLLHPRVSDTASLQVLTDQVFELCHTWADAEQLVVLDRHVLQLFQPESCFFFKQSADEEFEFQEAGVRRGGERGERGESGKKRCEAPFKIASLEQYLLTADGSMSKPQSFNLIHLMFLSSSTPDGNG